MMQINDVARTCSTHTHTHACMHAHKHTHTHNIYLTTHSSHVICGYIGIRNIFIRKKPSGSLVRINLRPNVHQADA